MIGWLRAAWDDSRRAAYTRRGSNPMSREEWFDLHDVISKLDAKIRQLPDLDTQRKLFDLYGKKDVYTCDVYTNDLDEYLDAVGVASPFTDAQEARIRELVLDETNRAWKEATKDLLGPANSAELGLKLSEPVEQDREQGGGLLMGAGALRSGSESIPRDGLGDDELVGDVSTECVGHDSSPSAADGGAHSVGDGQVAGVETAAPVTDATAVFAGPGLFRFDGTQVHVAEPATPDDVSRAGLDDLTRQIADYLEVLYDQDNSWSTIARLTRHVFTTPSDT